MMRIIFSAAAPLGLGVLLMLGSVALAQAAQLPGCAEPTTGGEWPLYGQDLRNSRAQPEETKIDAAAARDLEVAWSFRTSTFQSPQFGAGGGLIQSSPVVKDGCVYFGTDQGWVFALNADTGAVVWSRKLPIEGRGLLCTGIIGATAVKDGRVYAIVSQPGRPPGTNGPEDQGQGPYLSALDQATGEELWRSTIDTTDLVYNCGSPVPFEDIVIAPFNGDQTGTTNRGGWALFDAASGALLKKTITIPLPPPGAPDDRRGGGVWTTPTVDAATKYAYAGTSNPDAGGREHPHTNSLLKFDVDRTRSTFGEIVGHYKGNPDRYLIDDTLYPPTCMPNNGEPPLPIALPGGASFGRDADVFVRDILCLQFDIDFGASPQLYEGPAGRTYLGGFQKSGTFHMVDAETMTRVWSTPVSGPFFYSNSSSPATDGRSVFVGASIPGHMVALDIQTGLPRWVGPIGDLLHYNAVAYANGLVYTTDTIGFLNIYQSDTGLLVTKRPMQADVGDLLLQPNVTSAAVSIARHRIYAPALEHLIVYKPAAMEDGPGPVQSGCEALLGATPVTVLCDALAPIEDVVGGDLPEPPGGGGTPAVPGLGSFGGGDDDPFEAGCRSFAGPLSPLCAVAGVVDRGQELYCTAFGNVPGFNFFCGDRDGDGVPDVNDSCANVPNPNQADSDGDGFGDACDAPPPTDTDNDGVVDGSDNCPTIANPDQADLDGDGIGNACDTQDNRDTDGDGVQNHADQCPNEAGPANNGGCPVVADTTPDPFGFTSVSGVSRNTTVSSNVVTITGMTPGVAVPVTISDNGNNSQYRVNGGNWVTGGVDVRDGDTVQVRHTSASAANTVTETVLTIGTVVGEFRSTTAAGADTDPDAFSFGSKSNVPVSTWVESDPVTPVGYDAQTTVKAGAGTEYSIGCTGSYTSAQGTINPGQSICVRHMSASAPNTLRKTSLQIGRTVGYFTTRTAP
jgi:outer membrane protein assembly factor BamB